MPKVSVIIPVYGVEKYIERCACSLFEQTLKDIEFVFVNDCTPDHSIEVLQSVVARYPQRDVKIVHHEKNKGLAGARKTGFQHASGEFLACCDSDDWMDLDAYESLLKVAEEQNADIVAAGFYMESKKGQEVLLYDYSEHDEQHVYDITRFGGVYGSIANKLVRAELYKRSGVEPWEGINMWEDSCLTLRLRPLSRKTVILNRAFYHYDITNEGSITYNFSAKKVKEMIAACQKLDAYFMENGISDGIRFCNYLKIHATEILLKFASKENISWWKEVFPEKRNYIWSYPRWRFAIKLRAWLVDLLPVGIAYILCNIKKKR